MIILKSLLFILQTYFIEISESCGLISDLPYLCIPQGPQLMKSDCCSWKMLLVDNGSLLLHKEILSVRLKMILAKLMRGRLKLKGSLLFPL